MVTSLCVVKVNCTCSTCPPPLEQNTQQLMYKSHWLAWVQTLILPMIGNRVQFYTPQMVALME